MSDSAEPRVEAPASSTRKPLAPRDSNWPLWERLGILAVLALSGGIELNGLSQLGYGNTFYAAAVLSMTQSLHAFLFNSFDPTGFVTIDKPPLGFWVQVLSAKLLGFSGFSILLPEALATVGSVALLYILVRRAFGPVAGLLAGLMLALTPVTMTTGRSNTIDSLLVFVLLLATWTAVRATEKGSLRWLLATGVLVGLGFEIKMMEAYLALPALGVLYLLAAPHPRWTRVGHLTLATSVLLVVSFAWPVAVDLTPASQRPWVDSTQNNSAVSLALGYNGFQRLLGQNRSVTQFISGLTQPSANTAPGGGGFRGGPGGAGAPGPLRLFSQQLGVQASWLTPLAILGLAVAGWEAWRRRRTLASSRQGQAAILWGTWLLTTAAFFSVASRFQSYYLVTLAPPTVALAAIGVWGGWQAFRRGGWLGWLLPLAAVATGLVEAHILDASPGWADTLTPIVLGAAALAAAVVLVCWLGVRLRPSTLRRPLRLAAGAGAGVAVLALLVAPGAYGSASSQRGGQRPGGFAPPAAPTAAAALGGFPGGRQIALGGRAGAGGAAGFGFGGGAGGQQQTGLISYLEQQQGSATYLAATPSSMAAAPLSLASDKPVMSLGGFMGSDPILSVQQFAQLVQNGTVRFYLAGGGGFGGQRGNSAISNWVQASCALVPASAYAGADAGAQSQLYDCAGASASNAPSPPANTGTGATDLGGTRGAGQGETRGTGAGAGFAGAGATNPGGTRGAGAGGTRGAGSGVAGGGATASDNGGRTPQ